MHYKNLRSRRAAAQVKARFVRVDKFDSFAGRIRTFYVTPNGGIFTHIYHAAQEQPLPWPGEVIRSSWWFNRYVAQGFKVYEVRG